MVISLVNYTKQMSYLFVEISFIYFTIPCCLFCNISHLGKTIFLVMQFGIRAKLISCFLWWQSQLALFISQCRPNALKATVD